MHTWIFACRSIKHDNLFLPSSKRAFKDSMDVQKHGGKVYLPGHLHENLPESLQQVLTSNCIRGATANEESASYGPRHRQKTSPNTDGE
jgi:hypothetical protein